MILTFVAAFGIVAGAVVLVCLYRFTGLFVNKPTEESIARNLDFSDPRWVDTLLELSLVPFQKDFSVYSAFSYTNGKNTLTQIYATRAKLDDIRSHYKELLNNSRLSEKNSEGVLELSGEIKERKVLIMNYFSEVSNLIQVEMEMSGEYAGMIRRKLTEAFPAKALAAVPEIAAFASGESNEGYVMYNHDTFARDVYPGIPLFSRAYSFSGSMEELEEKVKTLGQQFKNSAVTDKGIAKIKHGTWLYQINALESSAGVKVVLIIQAIPEYQSTQMGFIKNIILEDCYA
jgi:hypothetical protein